MEPAPHLLLLSLLWGCSGQPADKLVVMPQQPVVRYGGSVQLNCSLACAEGTVQWKGLDTNLGSVTTFPTHSILHVSSAVVATGGTRICQGTCHRQRYQHAVDLKVYALPDTLQLEAEPHALEPGQPTSLRCSARRVYPPTGLGLTWYRGDQVLEETDFDVTETDEELFDIVSTLPVAGKDVGEGVEFRCKVMLSIGQETFTRVASVVASAGALPPATQRPEAETMLELAAATKPPSTERPAPRDLVTGSPTARLATTTLPGSTEKGTGPSVGTAPACSLQIWSLPPHGTRSSTLRLDHAEPQHQGHYQCALLGHSSQVVSLQLMVSDDTVSTGPAVAVGTTFSLLGLIVSGVMSHRLWKRFRSQYELP
ncbi:PREDICTED: mucosal addressin cell adhesion molecule 1 [Charadrius vociferus]|uniref:mucosal addressin cell adhesion molecule 1 n=1 Tax=Charadrius vociferus TaxID=50402 RepID=UPI0005212DDC|nr:PREDICTED: mucosal addressin cell adhesion molecule 1 [Charadrius vociferus]